MWRGEVTAGAAEVEGEGEDGGTGGTLGYPSAWFLGSAAFAAVGFAEPELPEMTVYELKLQARASGGHDAKDQFPVGMRMLQMEAPFLSCDSEVADKGFWTKLKDAIHQFIEELMAPPTKSAIIGFVVGLVSWLKSLIVGYRAPFKVIQDSLQLMGDDTIPCITLILGGNLTQGLRKLALKCVVIVAILCVRFVLLPLIGIAVVRATYGLGFLSRDPLYRYVLMVQFVVPPAMSIGTMSQLFDIGREECSVIFLWMYLFVAVALTAWSTVFMSVLS
ncbi:protein PIN-LIKES 7 [Zea mays]|uniref:protein PIN-LIKES 7 n=1 Tax=Zea mays TaxID=4577 RepID=UPI0004DE80E6|nr:protein PIN-LIKES 7 [Zea mays]|eukprot:XP_008675756.1 protein PIN-LIKES 7 [Zea mays]